MTLPKDFAKIILISKQVTQKSSTFETDTITLFETA
jgi:hypothetical protein